MNMLDSANKSVEHLLRMISKPGRMNWSWSIIRHAVGVRTLNDKRLVGDIIDLIESGDDNGCYNGIMLARTMRYPEFADPIRKRIATEQDEDILTELVEAMAFVGEEDDVELLLSVNPNNYMRLRLALRSTLSSFGYEGD